MTFWEKLRKKPVEGISEKNPGKKTVEEISPGEITKRTPLEIPINYSISNTSKNPRETSEKSPGETPERTHSEVLVEIYEGIPR